MQSNEVECRVTMQTDAISSQPVRAATPVAKLSLNNSLHEEKKNFDYHLDLAMRNEASEEPNDSVLKESPDDSPGEESESTALTENETKLAKDLAADQHVDRDIAAADRHGLPAESQAFTMSPDRTSKAGFVKVLNAKQDPDTYENNSASVTVDPENQETQSLEAINAEQSRQHEEVAAETGIALMYQGGFVMQGSLVGNVRQLQEDVISERPNSGRAPKIYDKENANFPVQSANISHQQPVSKSGIPLQGGKISVPESPLVDTVSNAPKISSQFQALDAKQLDVVNATPVLSTPKEMQLLTAREVTPNTTGSLQNPIPSSDTAANPLPGTVSTLSPKLNGGFLTEPDSSVPISDQRWGSNPSSLAVKSISASAVASEFVGNVVGGAVSKSIDLETKTFFLDEGRTDDIPLLSRESLTPNGPVRFAESVFSHPATARAVASQMVDALSNAQSKKIEIALNPEELGRVRMVLSTTDAGISVSIVAERPETLDLMRRHIGQLTEEFRNLGYVDIRFDFSGDGTNSRFDESSEGRQGFTEMEPDNGSTNGQPGPETENSTRSPVLRGLDMRL